MGNPVAFEASAELRDTRGFISTITMRPVCGIDGELHVRSAGIDADLAQAGERGVAHHLIFAIGQRLRRRDRDRIAGVHAHGIEIFDGADDDGVVGQIAHHLQLEFLPAEHAFFDQHFMHRRKIQAAFENLLQILAVVGDAAAGAAHREAGPQNHRVADARGELQPVFDASSPVAIAADRGRSSRIASLNSSRSSAFLIESIFAPISSTP